MLIGIRVRALATSVCLLPALTACEVQIETEEDEPNSPLLPAPNEPDPWASEPLDPWDTPPPSPPSNWPDSPVSGGRSGAGGEAGAAAGGITGHAGAGGAPTYPARPVERMRELLITDTSVVNSTRASEGHDGAPWSLRTQLEWLSAGDDAAAFTRKWLEEWRDRTAVGDYSAPVAPRPDVGRLLIEPWLSTGQYGEATPYWNAFPFRLIAIVNRIDLAIEPCAGPAGELRYVYTAVDGVRRPLEMTVIVEIPYPSTHTPVEWARRWHALGALPRGDTYDAALESLTREVSEHASRDAARVRSNERALAGRGGPWELREYRVVPSDDGASLAQVPLEFTPRSDADGTALSLHLVGNSEAILEGAVALPGELRAGAAQIPSSSFSWPAPSVSEPLRLAFSRETCNGCHGGDAATLPFQHIAPQLGAPAQLSRFLTDELSRRVRFFQDLLTTRCDQRSTPEY